MSKHDTMHRAGEFFFEGRDGVPRYFCAACGKETANIGTGVTPRHKGNVSPYKSDLRLVTRQNVTVAVVSGSYHNHTRF